MPGLTLRAAILAALAAAAVAASGCGGSSSNDASASNNQTVTLGGPGKEKVVIPPLAERTADSQAKEDAAGADEAAHSDLHAEPPLPAGTAAANDAEKPAGQPTIPAHVPLAAPSTPGCRTLLVRNFSSRRGAPVLLFVFHYTVSRDSGWAGVLGNVKWFDSPAAQASSNYIVDRRVGACALVVAESQKAWAQAAYNPWAISVEVTANGSEGSYFPPGPGRQRIIALMHRAHHVWKIPYRYAQVSGGRVLRTGFLEHKDLGAAGGGHVDASPYSINDLIAEAARTDGAAPKPIANVDVIACRKLNWWRTHGRPGGVADANAVARRKSLAAHGVVCTPSGPQRK
jgi:hypothetical protein